LIDKCAIYFCVRLPTRCVISILAATLIPYFTVPEHLLPASLNAPVTGPVICTFESVQIADLLAELKELREQCLAMEKEFATSIGQACPASRRSAQNLIDYLALRRHDLRDLRARLAALGLSSVGRSEANILAGIEAVIAILESLAGKPAHTAATFKTGPATLAKNADELLGPAPKGRAVRIMVTMPSEAAHSPELIKGLVEAGMDVMRINCAHDTRREWERMIAHMRRANRESGKNCKAQMDLGGPKLRTGPIHRGYHVVRWRIGKDARGAVMNPARIALVGKDVQTPPSADVVLPVSEGLLRAARLGDTFRIKDSRGKTRQLTVINKSDHACLCTCEQGAWVLSHAELSLVRQDGEHSQEIHSGHVGDLPFVEEPIRLQPRDLLALTKGAERPPAPHSDLPHISCTLPEVFSTAMPGQPIFFDDGKIEGRICEVHPEHMLVEIMHTGAREVKLGSGKGINLPETDLGIGAITEKDRHDLDFVAEHADIVALSFVRRPEDVLELQRELAARGKSKLGIVLKIESRAGFDQLPLIMIAARRHHPVGIMVARGDLAIEAGFERLAEIQAEILWLSEAAHMPVIRAGQVLEKLARTGIPSLAEVTDAAMGVRAECVMLNKGEYILDAVRFLDQVLHRMQAHHLKKRSAAAPTAVGG
jgi:pyruvate kinase